MFVADMSRRGHQSSPSIAAGEGASGTTDSRPQAIVVAKKSG